MDMIICDDEEIEDIFQKLTYLYNNSDPHVEIADEGYQDNEDYYIKYNIITYHMYLNFLIIYDLYYYKCNWLSLNGYLYNINIEEIINMEEIANFINKQIRLTKIRNIK